MSHVDIAQRIIDLEQKFQDTSNMVAKLENKIVEHRVALSNDAVGQIEAIHGYELELDRLIQQQMFLKQKISVLHNQTMFR